jgi:hypothetical protein
MSTAVETFVIAIKEMEKATEALAASKEKMEAAKIALLNSSNTSIRWSKGSAFMSNGSLTMEDCFMPILTIMKGKGYGREFFFEMRFTGNVKPSLCSTGITEIIRVLEENNRKGKQTSMQDFTFGAWSWTFFQHKTSDFEEVVALISNFLEEKLSELQCQLKMLNQ